MTPHTRLRLIRLLGSVLLVTPFAAGLAGFDPLLWLVFWAAFAMWHIGVQAPLFAQSISMTAALTAQGAVVALLMGLGHAAGFWANAVLSPATLIAIAVAAALLGRLIRGPLEAPASAAQGTDTGRQNNKEDGA